MHATLAASAYNLLHMAKLAPATPRLSGPTEQDRSKRVDDEM